MALSTSAPAAAPAPQYEWKWNRLVQKGKITDTDTSTKVAEGAKAALGAVGTAVTGPLGTGLGLTAGAIATPFAFIAGLFRKEGVKDTVGTVWNGIGSGIKKSWTVPGKWTIEKGRGVRNGVDTDVDIGSVEPGKEMENLKASERAPVDIRDPESIKRYFAARREAGDFIPSDNDVNFIVLPGHGLIMIEDKSTNPPTYEGYRASKGKGELCRESVALMKAARALIATKRGGGEAAAAFDKYDIVFFNVSNMGGDKAGTSLTLRGFNYTSRQDDGTWDNTAPLLRHGPDEWFSDGYGVEIKCEDSLKHELGRVFGLVDGEKLQGNKGSGAEESAKKGAAARSAPSPRANWVPPGMRKVDTEPDGLCGYRALMMGDAIKKGMPEDNAKKAFNSKGSTDFMQDLREGLYDELQTQIGDCIEANGTIKNAQRGTLSALLHTMAVAVDSQRKAIRNQARYLEDRDPVRSASLMERVAGYKKLKKDIERAAEEVGSGTLLNLEETQWYKDDVAAAFGAAFTDEDFQANELVLRLFGSKEGQCIRLHQCNPITNSWTHEDHGTAAVANESNVIHLLYAGDGGGGHYSLLRPKIPAWAELDGDATTV